MILILLSYAIFAMVFTITKAGLQYSQPVFFVAMRMLFGGVLLLGYQYLFKRSAFYLPKKHIGSYIKIAIFQIFLGYSTQLWAMQYLRTSSSALIYSMAPFFAAGFSYLYFGEKMTKKKGLGFAIGMLGMVPMLLNNVTAQFTEFFGIVSIPELVTMISVIFYAYSWVITRYLVKDNGLSVVMVNGVAMIGGGLLALASSPFLDVWDPLPFTDLVPLIKILAAGVLVGNVISFNLYAFLMKKYTTTMVMFGGFIQPFYTALYGWLLLGELVTPKFFASSFIIFIGLYLFYQEELRQGYVEKSFS